MKAGTLFSGIGAPECAAPDIDWRWCAEIDPFASAVHAARFPGVPNLGDVEKIDADTVEPVDLIVFGSPCQSFSVAGKRLGLDDPRGNLALVGLRLIGRIRPQWVVWENVPGVLSSDGGRDFGAFLGCMAELGYGFAYAVLDAQHFGVPQRRRRVFAVGCLGDWRGPAAVLFEPESLRGDSPPRREAGERIADPITASFAKHHGASGGKDSQPRNHIAFGGSGYRADADTADNLIAFSAKDDGGDAGDTAPTLRAGMHAGSHANAGVMPAIAFDARNGIETGETTIPVQAGGDCKRGYSLNTIPLAFGGNNTAGPVDVATACNAHGGPHGRLDFESETFVAHSLRADGFDAEEDGTGRGTPIIPVQCNGSNVGTDLPSLRAGNQHITGGGPAVMTLAIRGRGDSHDLEYCDDGTANAILQPGGGRAGIGVGAVAFTASEQANGYAWERPVYPTLHGQVPNDSSNIQQGIRQGMSVRRLTPRECERLQGFPDDFTAIAYRGKPAADRAGERRLNQPTPPGHPADGPRYRALGNSMAVPVIGWILRRVQQCKQELGL